MPGFERWWDGGTWSHVTRPAPGAVQPQAYQQPYQQQPYQQQPYQQPRLDQPLPAGSSYSTGPRYSAAHFARPTTPDGAVLGSRWARLGASLLDGLIVGPLAWLLVIPQLNTVTSIYRTYVEAVMKSASDGSRPPNSATLLSDSGFLRAIVVIAVVSAIVRIVYATVLVALRGATLGKMIVGLRVRPVANDGRVGWGTSLLRAVAAVVPGLIPLVNYVFPALDSAWCLWDPQRQCLHDKIARTVVVNRR